MCLLFVYLNPSPVPGQYRLVMVSNRDETFTRPTKPAHFWPSGILAGMDLEKGREGGTWLGVGPDGKIGCLLNILQPANQLQPEAASRGFLVVDYLVSPKSGHTYIDDVSKSGKKYSSFNLITVDPAEGSYVLNYYNHDNDTQQKLDPGIHGFGNSFYDKPFQKVEKGRKKLAKITEALGRVEKEAELVEALQTMMGDTEPNYPDTQIAEQGQGYTDQLLEDLSSIWVTCPKYNYGTRTTTVILVDYSGRVGLWERTMKEPINLHNLEWDLNHYTFNIKNQEG